MSVRLRPFGVVLVTWAILATVVSAEPAAAFAGTETQRTRREKELALVKEIHLRIAARRTNSPEAPEMRPYTNSVPGQNAPFVMLPIPGGDFVMGSPPMEPGRQPDEGPPHRVRVSPFWMQQCEVTWEEYEPFMMNAEGRPITNPTTRRETADAVAKPSKPYLEMSFGMGKKGCPAVGMTQHAANKYCQWLSAKTGHFYRLPTEAEWEYACRAGTTSAYSFGEDPSRLSQFAWFEENSGRRYHPVGRKPANAWGLHDMHGNIAEWCLDQYDPTFYGMAGDRAENPWNKATKPYPHIIRGGAWESLGEMPGQNTEGSPAAQLRSAARQGSRREWKTDPTLPPSIWYLDRSSLVGFRIVRPLRVPSPEEMDAAWNSGVEFD